MRIIKFRGTTLEGSTIYGDLTHHNGHIFVGGYRVTPESVVQLVGYDESGGEIYEGDTVLFCEAEFVVSVEAFAYDRVEGDEIPFGIGELNEGIAMIKKQ